MPEQLPDLHRRMALDRLAAIERNYDWMVRNRGLDDVSLEWDTGTIVYGDGGATIETLCEPGFTPAT